jgi:hypothetical protein
MTTTDDIVGYRAVLWTTMEVHGVLSTGELTGRAVLREQATVASEVTDQEGAVALGRQMLERCKR